MTTLTYNGPDDIRILDAADLQKADVDTFRKKSFRKGEAVEVSDEVAIAIAKAPNLFGDFTAEGVDIDTSEQLSADEEITVIPEEDQVPIPATKDEDWVEPVAGDQPVDATATPAVASRRSARK